MTRTFIFVARIVEGIQFVNLQVLKPLEVEYDTMRRIDASKEDVHQALLDLVQDYSKNVQNISVQRLEFINMNLNRDFLMNLSNSISWDKSSLCIDNCGIQMSQEEFEDWICPLNLESFKYVSNVIGEVEINDKVMCSVRDFVSIHPNINVLRPEVTDLLLEQWKEKPPIRVNIFGSQTSFTLKAVTELIKLAVQNRWTSQLVLGNIECSTEDRKYLIELQQISNVDMRIGEDYKMQSDLEYVYPQFMFKPIFI